MCTHAYVCVHTCMCLRGVGHWGEIIEGGLLRREHIEGEVLLNVHVIAAVSVITSHCFLPHPHRGYLLGGDGLVPVSLTRPVVVQRGGVSPGLSLTGLSVVSTTWALRLTATGLFPR